MRLEEHAVSRVMEGPRQSKKYETRLDKILLPIPVAVYIGAVFTTRLRVSGVHIWAEGPVAEARRLLIAQCPGNT